MRLILKEFNNASGYYDVFIPALKELSSSYSDYYKQTGNSKREITGSISGNRKNEQRSKMRTPSCKLHLTLSNCVACLLPANREKELIDLICPVAFDNHVMIADRPTGEIVPRHRPS